MLSALYYVVIGCLFALANRKAISDKMGFVAIMMFSLFLFVWPIVLFIYVITWLENGTMWPKEVTERTK